MKQELGATWREQRESFFGICIVVVLLLLKIPKAKGNGWNSDTKPCQVEQEEGDKILPGPRPSSVPAGSFLAQPGTNCVHLEFCFILFCTSPGPNEELGT